MTDEEVREEFDAILVASGLAAVPVRTEESTP